MHNITQYCRTLLITALLSATTSLAVADSGNLQFEYAANGRFDLLQKLLEQDESKGHLKTPERHALCYAYSKTKHYSKLLHCLDQLEDNIKKGDIRTRLFALEDATPAVYLMRADALIELGQYAAAITEAKRVQAWQIKEDSDEKDIEIHSLMALSLASTLSGQKKEGQQFAEQLSKVSIGFLHKDFAQEKALALGRAYMALGEYQKALDAIRSDSTFEFKVFLDNLFSGAVFRGVNNWAWIELPRALMINKALAEVGKLSDAKAGFDKLLEIPHIKENGEIYWLTLSERARIAEQEKQPELAIKLYKQAIDVIETQRKTIHTETNKIGFVGDKQAVYGRLIALLFQTQKNAEAYEYMERGKARALVDLLSKKEHFGTDSNLSSMLTDYRIAEEEAQTQLSLDMSMPNNATQSTSRRSVAANKLDTLKKAAPELASLVSVSNVSLDEIKTKLLPNEVIVQYYFYGQSLYVVTLSQDSVQAEILANQNLEDQVRNFRINIEKNDPNVMQQAQALYDALLRPIEKHLGEKDILFIPHGVLHYLPFTALHDGQDYLLKKRTLRYLPSASILKYLKTSQSGNATPALVLGNPDLGDAKLDLPDAQTEAETVAVIFDDSKLLVRGEASESEFKKLAPNFRYLHIASHGQFNADAPLQSRLLLSKAKTSQDDGSLTVDELYSLNLQAELTTLSACETGLGKILNGDDVVGLTRGFLYAGSKNVVASLWQVDDRATSILMEQFYTYLKNGKTKREALRQAQLDVQAEFKHPYFWAAFFLTGQGI